MTSDAGPSIDWALVRIAIVVVLGSLMSTLDSTIVNVAIGRLSSEFGQPLGVTQWVSSGYLLALVTVIPVTGWAADRFGAKQIHIFAMVVFLVGSLLCGFAPSAAWLIASRVLQGLGGGMIVPAGTMILARAAGPERIGRLLGIVGAPMFLGSVLGPALGGFLVQFTSWRWIFLVNLPLGVLALLGARRGLQKEALAGRHRLDRKGLALLAPGIVLFVYGLTSVAAIGGPVAVGSILCGSVLALAFVRHVWDSDQALIDVRLFARPVLNAAALITFLFGIVFFGLGFLMPLYFQAVRGQSAFSSGLALAAQGFGTMIAMPIAGRLSDSLSPHIVILAGLAFMGGGTLWLSWMAPAMPVSHVETLLFVIGLGAGSTPTTSAVLRTLAHGEIARATSGLNAILRIGGLAGTALFAGLLNRSLAAPAVPTALAGSFSFMFMLSFGIIVLAMLAAFFLPREGKGAAALRSLVGS